MSTGTWRHGLLPEVSARMTATASASALKARLTGSHVRVARGLLGWSQVELAKRARVTIEALRDIEADRSVAGPILRRVRDILERASVDLSRAGPRLQAR